MADLRRDALILNAYARGETLRDVASRFGLSIMGVRLSLTRSRAVVRDQHANGVRRPRVPDEACGWC